MKFIICHRNGCPLLLLAALLSLYSCSKKDSGPKGPAITGFSVDTVWVGKIITISGSDFNTTVTENSVRIGNTAVTEIITASATSLTIKVPAGAVSGKVFVKANGKENASAKDLVIVNQLVWQKVIGGTSLDYALSVKSTADGGYLLAGYTYSTDGDVTGNHGGLDFWVVKVKADRTIAWQKALGGPGSDYATDVIALADGGCVAVGHTTSTNGDVTRALGNGDFWIVRLGADGAIVWQKTYGGTGTDVAQAVTAISNGYVVAGYTTSNDDDVSGNHGNNDIWVIKLDVNGNITGQKTFGGALHDYAYSLTTTADGGYLLAGRTYSTDGDIASNNGGGDYWVVKLNSTANIEWQKTLGGTGSDVARSIVTTSDGGSIVAGYTTSTNGNVTNNHGTTDGWVVKLNASGAIIWQKALGGSAIDQAQGVVATQDGGCAIAGYTNSTDGDVTDNHGGNDSWVVRLNSSGDLVWQKSVGGTMVDLTYSIERTSGNSFIVAGYSNSTDGDVSGGHGEFDFWLFNILD
jgi:hypothetical protein